MPILKTQSRTPPVLSRNRVISPLAWAKILPHVKARRPLGGLTQQFKSLNGETEAQSKIEASKLLPNSFRALTASHVVYEEESLDHDGIHQFFLFGEPTANIDNYLPTVCFFSSSVLPICHGTQRVSGSFAGQPVAAHFMGGSTCESHRVK